MTTETRVIFRPGRRTLTAIVVGGGVAGPATAMALARVGISCEVHEAAQAGRADGAGSFLTVQSNGIDALRAIDAAHVVVDHGLPTPHMRLTDHVGRPLGVVACGARLDDGTPAHTVMRADLYRALRAETQARGIDVHVGHRLVDVSQSDGGVTATFADGTSARADLLVGCDGLGSTVRSSIDPDAPPARSLPLLNLGAIARGVDLPDHLGELQMAFGRRAFALWLPGPEGEVWWGVNLPDRHDWAPDDLRAVSDAEWRRRIEVAFAGDDLPIPTLLAATDDPLVAWPTRDLPRVPTWHRGNVVLAGDAAHAASPSSGQGASLALEDAVQLARCLRDVGDVPSALAAYEDLRRDRVERVVRQGARTSSAKVAGPIGRVVRNAVMRLALPSKPRPPTRSMRWITDHHVDFAAQVVT